jgi:uncharacterized protein with HEPN domain
MMDDRARIHLLQMRDAASDALTFVAGFSEEEFLRDRRTQQAVCLSLIMLGENAIKLQDKYPEVLQSFDGIEWQNIRGMRNRLVHAYVDVNLQTVWSTVTRMLPRLVQQIESITG